MPGPIRWKSCELERSLIAKRYGVPAFSFVTFFPFRLCWPEEAPISA
jgi:hypothetical protein